MDSTLIILAFVTFLSTLIGGVFAVKFKKALPYFFAFAAGSLIAVTFFDILPESLAVSASVNLPVRYVMMTVVGSFLFYSFLEKYFLIHHHKENEGHGHIMGPIGAGSLVIHSFLDGVAIGAAFQINPSVGLIVALAVIFHDFTDGINTVTVMLKNRHHVKNAMKFLIFGSIAPALGISLTFLFNINQTFLSLMLAVFAGEFLYIGTVNLLPETYKYPNWRIFLATIMGIVLILGLTSLI
ncbi:MAG: ZIP family metal transporter [Candidatus Aenigmatarchaeota archaeon]